jgi:hypothetical protein
MLIAFTSLSMIYVYMYNNILSPGSLPTDFYNSHKSDAHNPDKPPARSQKSSSSCTIQISPCPYTEDSKLTHAVVVAYRVLLRLGWLCASSESPLLSPTTGPKSGGQDGGAISPTSSVSPTASASLSSSSSKTYRSISFSNSFFVRFSSTQTHSSILLFSFSKWAAM